MVENIPEKHRSDRALRQFFANMFTEQAVQEAYLVRNTAELNRLLYRVQEAQEALTAAEAGLASRGPGRCLFGSQEASPCARALAALEEEAQAERMRIERAGEAGGDPKVCSSVGFVTFSDRFFWSLASKAQCREKNTEAEFLIERPIAPELADVCWEELVQAHRYTRTRAWLGGVCLFLLFLCWSPFVLFISSWTTLSTIKSYVPLVAAWVSRFPALAAALEGVLATAALNLFLALLPAILLVIIRQFFPVKAGARAQFQLQRWYFAFLVVFVLLVTALGRSIVITLAALLEEPTAVLSLLAESLPGASHFYLNYVVIGWATLTWQLLRPSSLASYWFYKASGHSADSARRRAWVEDSDSCGMGARMALGALISATTLAFCSCSPLILPLGVVYFFIGQLTYGYLLVHAETKKPDLGGEFWTEAQRQIYSALAIYVFLMTGVLWCRSGQRGPPALAFLALAALYLCWRRVRIVPWESLPLEALARGASGKGSADLEAAECGGRRYIQPELLPCSSHGVRDPCRDDLECNNV
jgi:hypothetical protein